MSKQVVFIDSRVPDIGNLLAGLKSDQQAFIINGHSDGLDQIVALLEANHLTDLSAISIVGHGASGEIDLGSTFIDDANLAGDAAALSVIGAAIARGGNLALFACDTAAGAAGQQFIADLSKFAGGVDVTAATHLVGSADLGGSWTLDASTGPAAAPANLPFTNQALANFHGALGTLGVTAGATAIYQGGGTAQPLDATLTVTDFSSAPLVGASVQIHSFAIGDMLNFTDQNNIHGNYNSTTGLLTLSGSDTAADYQAALRSVTYSFAGNGDPTAGGHQQTFVTWQVSDGNAADVLPTPINNDQPTLGLNQLVVMYGLFPAYDSDNGTSDGGGIPLGAIRTFAGGTVWGGTAAADGQVLSLQQNTALFSVLGTNYGGDGSTNFALPNLQARIAVGFEQNPSTGAFLGQTTGSDTVTLTHQNLPANWGGSGQPVNNDQPSLTLNYIINTGGAIAGAGGSSVDGVGEVVPFLGQYAPAGYLFAAGQLLAISQYSNLYDALGTTYGGDGTSTFALPDLTGKTIIGAGTSLLSGTQVTIGTTSGQDSTALVSSNLPFPEGSNVPISNQQPSLALTYLIDPFGIFPSSSGAPTADTADIGEIVAFAGAGAALDNMLNAGWMVANGAILPIASYQALFSVIGTTYGGNGTTNFVLPDLVGHSVAGVGSSNGTSVALGQDYGTANIALASNQVPLTTSTLDIAHTAPTVAAGATVAFAAGDAAVALDSTLTVDDVDSGGNLTGATIKIGSGFVAGDTLHFVNQIGISGSYVAGTGILTLNGNDTLAHYQAALESITFSSTDGNPGSRTIDWSVTDGAASNGTSATATSTVNLAPTIGSVTAATTGNATDLAAGKIATITVNFTGSVNVTGTPELQLSDNEVATYVSGSGTAALTFSYTVQPNDSTADLQVQSLLTNGGTIKDGNGNDAGLANAATDLHLQVDTTAPSASSIAAAGANPNNATVETFTVTFSESVAGVDATDFAAATTGTVADTGIAVTPVSGSVYTVTVNGVTGDGTLGLNLNASGTGIADAAGNAISGGATGQIYTIEHTPPAVSSVDVPANDTYGPGKVLTFTANFTENVLVTTGGGTPYIDVTLDTGGTVHAAYTGGTGTSQLTFTYTVANGNDDTNGVTVGSSIVLNGGTIKDAATNSAALTLNNVASTTGVLVDAIPPTVTAIDTVDGSPNNLGTEHFAVTFSTAVSGVDASDFTLVGTGTASGAIGSVSGNGTTWTVTVNSVTGDGTLRLDLNNAGDAITDNFGNTLTAGHTGDQSYTIDHTAPAITGVTVPANATYVAGQALDFTTTFSEAVTVTGTPRIALTLDTGGTVYADYVSGSGTNTLIFRDVAAPGQQDLTGIATASAIDLNGGIIKDAAGNAANGAGLNLTGEPPTAGVDIDAIVPAVSSVTVPVNGTYGTAQDLDFTVSFTKAVTVNTGGGVPYIQVTLDTGGTVDATYLSGSGTSALVFRYVVASGELDSNGITVGSSLVLNGATIRDPIGNNAATALNNVGSTTGVLVDSIPPTVTSINTADASPNNLSTEHFTVTFSADVSLNPPDTTDFSLHATGTVSGTVASVSAVSGSVYTVTVTGVTGDGTMRLDLNPSGSTITDAFGNVLTATHTGDQSYTIDHIAPGAPAVVLAHDTGTSNTDGITSDPSITITPAESGGLLLYKIDGATGFSSAAPNFATNGSADGPHTVTVEQQDAAGNIGAPTTFHFTLDTIAPAAPVHAMSLAHDTGISGTHNLTNDPTIAYTAPASGDYFLFKVDNGSFSTAVPPAFATDHSADGLHTISLEEVDIAGNISAPEILTFKLDTIAPAITAVTAAPSNGIEGVGETVAIMVAFGEAVAVTGGTPTLSLNDHGTATYDAAATAALHDASKLVFDYTVGVSDTITSPLAVTGINLHGAGIEDFAGNAANLGHVATTFAGLGIDSSLITAHPDSNRVVAGQTVSADAAHGVLANDTDSNPSDRLVVGAVDGLPGGVNQPVAGAYGSLTMHADGSYAYSAGGAVAGVAFDTFTYTAGNGHSTPSTSTLTVEVVGANQNFVFVPSGGSATGGYGNTVLDGSAGNATLTAATTFNAHQILIGGPGDVLNAASFGQDTFVFANNFGHETINNFHPALDVIQLQQSQFGGLAAVMADIRQVGADSVLTLDANHVITIANTPHASLTAADFHLM